MSRERALIIREEELSETKKALKETVDESQAKKLRQRVVVLGRQIKKLKKELERIHIRREVKQNGDTG